MPLALHNGTLCNNLQNEFWISFSHFWNWPLLRENRLTEEELFPVTFRYCISVITDTREAYVSSESWITETVIRTNILLHV